jgi:tetratricopeptide (TPR) repeat protein
MRSTLALPFLGARRNRARACGLVLATVTALGAPAFAQSPSAPPASAEQKAVAKAHFDTAIGYLELERYAEAAEELEKSVAAYPSASALFNLGNAYQALHRYVDALAILSRLEGVGGAELKPELKTALARHLAEVRGLVGHLKLTVTPPGATLTLNGKPLSKAGEDVLLDPGEHLVRATLEGYRPAESTVALRPGDRKNVQLTLERALASLALTASPAGSEIWIDGQRRGVVPLAGPLPLEPGRHRLEIRHSGHETAVREFPVGPGERLEIQLALAPLARPSEPAPLPQAQQKPGLSSAFWIAAGGTAIAAGAAVTFAILASSRDGDLEQRVADYQALPRDTAQIRFDQRYGELEDLQKERDTFHVASVGLGGLALTGAVIAVALGWDAIVGGSEGPSARTHTTQGAWLTANGIGGRF